VTVKTPVDPLMSWNWLGWGYAWFFLAPPEVIKKYGDMQDGHNVVGTGPFMLIDFVANSSATLVRNPGYWETDPLGPGKGNQLPYADGIKILVVPDISTRLAALRTGKLDMIPDVEAEDAKGLIDVNPALRYRRFLSIFPYVVSMRIDKAELPYKDNRVRQALMMATDFDALKNDLYRGDAETLVFPVSSAFKRAYAPLEQMPEAAKALFRYNPDKAKQLLAEAGYPGGFKARMIVQNVPSDIDLASVYKAMWARVGVDIELQPRESAVYSSMNYARSWQEMVLTIAQTGFPQYLNFVGLRVFNDPIIEAAFQDVQKNVIVNQPEADRLYRRVMPHIVEQSYYIPRPSPNLYSMWWPWVKNHYGDQAFYFLQYAWIDQDLKQEMMGRR
jgi:peptide/nickel transport system substrate-binding protein